MKVERFCPIVNIVALAEEAAIVGKRFRPDYFEVRNQLDAFDFGARPLDDGRRRRDHSFLPTCAANCVAYYE